MSGMERLLGFYTSSLVSEGEKLIKLKGYSVYLEVLKGFRSMALIYLYAALAMALLAGSFFSLFIYETDHYSANGQFAFNWFVVAVSAVLIGSAAFLSWSMREQRWLEIIGMEQRLKRLLQDTGPTSHSGAAMFSRDDLERVIEAVLEQKTKKEQKEDIPKKRAAS